MKKPTLISGVKDFWPEGRKINFLMKNIHAQQRLRYKNEALLEYLKARTVKSVSKIA